MLILSYYADTTEYAKDPLPVEVSFFQSDEMKPIEKIQAERVQNM